MAVANEIDALGFERNLRETYQRYIYTANLISEREPELQNTVYEKLTQQFSISNGPFIHCVPIYETSHSLTDLVQGKADFALSESLLRLPVDEFDPTRPLYSHQVEAIRILAQRQNLVVATGTGSGKTECFLIPILEEILCNPGPGLRAIIVYPMNALADDQLGRLRRLLRDMPEVTFGRYTGDTPWSLRDPSERDEAPPNERFTRAELRAKPPHILLTNFAMLEYLLLRPQDADVFANNALRFIVLDEAHTYSGAQGIEIALLMRRLREYLVAGESPLQYILTSATMGDEPRATAAITRFAADMTGGEFQDQNVLRGQTVHEFAEELTDEPGREVLAAVGADGQGFSAWSEALSDADALAAKLRDVGLAAPENPSVEPSRLLFDLFCRSEVLRRIHEHASRSPSSFADLCKLVGLPETEESYRAIQWLIAIGAYARQSPDSAPLLPTRLHFFFRGLAGGTVCLYDKCPGRDAHPETGWSEFFLEDRSRCEYCSSLVLPISTCVHCGLPLCRVYLEDDKWRPSSIPNVPPEARLLTWTPEVGDDDDESEDDGKDGTSRCAHVCVGCGQYWEPEDDVTACCADQLVVSLSLVNADDGEGNLRTCPQCGGGSGSFYPSVFRDLRTQEEAPTAVLAETVIRNLPYDAEDEDKAALPANGRNLLVFSDSRQRAAFFAPYLRQTTLETAFLGPIKSAIENAEANNGRPVTIEETAQEFLRGLSEMPMVVVKKRDQHGIESYDLVSRRRLRSADRSAVKREAEIVLYQHFCSSPNQKTTLKGMALATTELDLTEDDLDEFPRAVPELFARGEAAGWAAVQALVELLVQQTAIDFPSHITRRDIRPYGPDASTFHLSRNERNRGRQIRRWDPYAAPPRSYRNAVARSRQLAILTRLLDLDADRDAKVLEALLISFWGVVKESMLNEMEGCPGEYRLDPNVLLLTTQSQWHLCEQCGAVTSLGALGFCLGKGCSGVPRELTPDEVTSRFVRNHYRQRYELPPMPIEVKEHTAQLTNECGKEYQHRFMSGEINVLSSSTTFEMGVDVGALKAVLLRNVPPTTSSYIQRAGRAGRRRDGISVAVTFCRNVPHDQYHYQNPEPTIVGEVPAPYLNLQNRPLTQRHCNSLLLGYFLRDVDDVDADVLNHLDIDSFFLTTFGSATLAQRFASWLEDDSVRRQMESALAEILPEDSGLDVEVAIEQAASSLVSDPSQSVLQRDVLEPLSRFQEQHDDVRKQRDRATGREGIDLARSLFSLERLQKQFKEQRLINFLSSCCWLPGYAFPQDIVKLLVRQPGHGERMRLQRDREVGISEYAPGAEIVADGYLFKSGGIWFNSKEPEVRQYARCPGCRKLDTYLETERPSLNCTRCGKRLSGIYTPRRYLKPDGFTTMVRDEVERPGRHRRRPPRTSEVFLLEGAAPDAFQAHTIRGVSYAKKKEGRLFLANSGYKFNGFYVCRKCGRAYTDNPGAAVHETPWGSRCAGRFIKLDLAHEFTTDILQLHFEKCIPSPPPISAHAFWRSLVAAVLNGASDALNIDLTDLGATHHGWTEESFIGELVIYDRIPGGAGHTDRIVGNLGAVLNAALARVRNCKCPDIDASCYACLRSYGNQFYWDELRRRPVIEWLSSVIGRTA